MTEEEPRTDADAVVDETANHRLVFESDGLVAELVYRRNGRRFVVVHTGVPEELRGRGIAGRLIAAAVQRAREEGLTLVPLCPYARQWLEEHPEQAASVSIDWPPRGLPRGLQTG